MVAGLAVNFVLAWRSGGFGENGLFSGKDLDELCGGQDVHSDRDLLCDTYVHGFLEASTPGPRYQRRA
jgi:hypothetical protein